MKNGYQAVLIRCVWVQLVSPSVSVVRPLLKAGFCMLAGLMMFAATFAIGQQACAMQFSQ